MKATDKELKEVFAMLNKNKQGYPVLFPDRRTRAYKLSKKYGVKFTSNKNYIFVLLYCRKEERKRHIKSGSDYVNVLGNPIVVDYKKNKGLIKFIYEDHIEFYGRNHWVKTEQDSYVS